MFRPAGECSRPISSLAMLVPWLSKRNCIHISISVAIHHHYGEGTAGGRPRLGESLPTGHARPVLFCPSLPRLSLSFADGILLYDADLQTVRGDCGACWDASVGNVSYG